MKKLCFLCPWMHVEGGLQRVASNLMNELTKNYEVTLCIISTSTEKPFYSLNKNISVEYLTESALNSLSKVRRCFGKLFSQTNSFNYVMKKIYYPLKRTAPLQAFLEKNNFDCVIGLSGDINMLLASADSSKFDSKLIGWQHNSFQDYFERRGSYYYGRKKTAKTLYSNLDYIVTLTKKDADRYRQEVNTKSLCIYNPLTFQVEKVENKPGNRLLFVGRLSWTQKGLKYLADVTKKIFSDSGLKEWKLIVVGDGDDRERLKHEFENSGVFNQVQMVGKKDNVTEYYQNSDILLNTSAWEGFGLVVTEAMECGVPVVSFDTDGPAEIISDGENGYLIKKYDTDFFAAQVMKLIKNEALRKVFSEKAVRSAKNFETEAIVNQWKKIIEV